MLKKYKFFASICIFVGGALFLATALFFHLNSKKPSSSEESLVTATYIMKKRLEAAKEVKQGERVDYQFEIFSPLPFPLPSVAKEEQ